MVISSLVDNMPKRFRLLLSLRVLTGLNFCDFKKSSMEQKSSVNIGPSLKSFLVKNFNGSMFLAIPHGLFSRTLSKTQVKELEEENRRLKKMYADVQLQKEIIQEAMRKKW